MTIWTVPARVTRVIDGDTLVADLDLGWGTWKIGAHIRLAGINCPEMDTDAGQDARDFVIAALTPAVANCTLVSKSLDKYGRVLGVVKLADGRILNDMILDDGHAVVMKG